MGAILSPELIQVLFAIAGAGIMYFLKPGSSLPAAIESAVANLLSQQTLAQGHAQLGGLVSLGTQLPTVPTLPTPPAPASPGDQLSALINGLLGKQTQQSQLSQLQTAINQAQTSAPSAAPAPAQAWHPGQLLGDLGNFMRTVFGGAAPVPGAPPATTTIPAAAHVHAAPAPAAPATPPAGGTS